MRSKRTNASPRLTLLPGGAGVGDNGSASTIYGPVRAGLTTSHRIPNQRLSELLNELERKIGDLEFKYLKVLDTSITDTILPAVRLISTIEKDTTK